MQTNSTDYPPEMPSRLIVPGVLRLNTIRWGYDKAVVTGAVGDDKFSAIVETAVLLDRRSFVRHLWRYHHVLAVLPGIEEWREAIAVAEGGAA